MNPITVEYLNRAEKYSRSKQIEAFRLRSKAQAVPPSQPILLQKVMRRLGGLPKRAGQWLEERNVSPDRQPHGQAQ
ncbi:MAG TPA: hypothetical protein VLY63_27275 [Anaerolineae bacterium]|nr:hypothetical protein [Anaerolineae bacterium]